MPMRSDMVCGVVAGYPFTSLSDARLLDGVRLGGIRHLLNTEARPTKNNVNAGQQQFQFGLGELAGSIHENTPADSNDLRHIRNRVVRKARDA